MPNLTPAEIENRIGDFLDDLPLDLSRGQAAMLFVRLQAFAAGLTQEPEAKKGRKWSAERRAKFKADLHANPARLKALKAGMKRASDIHVANAAARRAAA